MEFWMLGMDRRRLGLWWSGNRVGGVVVIVLELCENVVEVGRVSNRVFVFLREFAEVDLWVCSTKWKTLEKKQCFYNEWDVHTVHD